MDMSAEISWIFEAAVKPDELDEYRKLATEISADNEAAEPGQLNFEWYADGGDEPVHAHPDERLRRAGR
jgi:quinol monooxygenase YgiN